VGGQVFRNDGSPHWGSELLFICILDGYAGEIKERDLGLCDRVAFAFWFGFKKKAFDGPPPSSRHAHPG